MAKARQPDAGKGIVIHSSSGSPVFEDPIISLTILLMNMGTPRGVFWTTACTSYTSCKSSRNQEELHQKELEFQAGCKDLSICD